ncbi:MAG: methyltransferase family protein [Acidobacteriota bacterium]
MRVFAWLGAAAFAGALGTLVYFYVVILGVTSGDASTTVPHAVMDALLFAAFAAHHSAFARTAVKRWLTSVVPVSAERPVYVWVSSILLVLACLLWQPVPGMAWQQAGVWVLVHDGAQLMGLGLTVVGASAIDPRALAGIEAASRDAGALGAHRTEAPPRGDSIRVAGPFRIVRHPIYLGWLLMVWGTPTMTANRLVFAAVSSAYLILAIPWEERSLVEVHGDQYRAYQQAVRWRLLPGIW